MAVVVLGALLIAGSASAVLFYSTADPTHNTAAPTGGLAGSGWQYEGNWSGWTGTPIAPSYFVTAKHVGGAVGDPFYFQGVTYTTTAMFDDPAGDLRIWKVAGTFPAYAPLYTRQDEAGKGLVVIGRGTQRGAEVRANNALKGWQWGPYDGVMRWGQNKVSGIYLDPNGAGDYLQAAFDASGGPNEADLSAGDSGAGIFIRDGQVWKLAGIGYAVDGPFNTVPSGSGFEAAIFDQGGLFVLDSSGNWVLVPDRKQNIPAQFYATRISTRISWISSILTQP